AAAGAWVGSTAGSAAGASVGVAAGAGAHPPRTSPARLPPPRISTSRRETCFFALFCSAMLFSFNRMCGGSYSCHGECSPEDLWGVYIQHYPIECRPGPSVLYSKVDSCTIKLVSGL